MDRASRRRYRRSLRSIGTGHEATAAIGTALGLAAVALLVLATAFFVAAEFAIVATDRTRLEVRASGGSRGARVALAVHRRPSYHPSGPPLRPSVVSLPPGLFARPTIAPGAGPALSRLMSHRGARPLSG